MVKLLIVTVVDDDKAVNLYQTLYAVPEPHVGVGVAPTAFFKSPVAIDAGAVVVQVSAGVRFSAPVPPVQLTWATIVFETKIIIKNKAVVRTACNMV